jgi:hypothetical protein
VKGVSERESSGDIERWRSRLAADDALRSALLDADSRYRKARHEEGGGVDPLPEAGIGGERDVLKAKCLHAHVAAWLAGIEDPIGKAVTEDLILECGDEICGG